MPSTASVRDHQFDVIFVADDDDDDDGDEEAGAAADPDLEHDEIPTCGGGWLLARATSLVSRC